MTMMFVLGVLLVLMAVGVVAMALGDAKPTRGVGRSIAALEAIAQAPEEMRALPEAGWNGNAAAVDLMLSLGFDPGIDGQDRGTVLHCAAWQGAVECVEVALRYEGVRALLERRDGVHHGTPLGWCCHGARYARNGGDHARVARALLEAGAEPGPNLEDAPESVLAVMRDFGLAVRRGLG